MAALCRWLVVLLAAACCHALHNESSLGAAGGELGAGAGLGRPAGPGGGLAPMWTEVAPNAGAFRGLVGGVAGQCTAKCAGDAHARCDDDVPKCWYCVKGCTNMRTSSTVYNTNPYWGTTGCVGYCYFLQPIIPRDWYNDCVNGCLYGLELCTPGSYCTRSPAGCTCAQLVYPPDDPTRPPVCSGVSCTSGTRATCPAGVFCEAGCTNSSGTGKCPAGSYYTNTGANSSAMCSGTSCPAGLFCEAGCSNSSGTGECPAGSYYTNTGANSSATCSGTTCPAGLFCEAGCASSSGTGKCPAGSYYTATGLKTAAECSGTTCPAGLFCEAGCTSSSGTGKCAAGKRIVKRLIIN